MYRLGWNAAMISSVKPITFSSSSLLHTFFCFIDQ
jgi:hypothetical protein